LSVDKDRESDEERKGAHVLGRTLADGAEEDHQTHAGGTHNEAGQPETPAYISICNTLTLAQVLLSGRS